MEWAHLSRCAACMLLAIAIHANAYGQCAECGGATDTGGCPACNGGYQEGYVGGGCPDGSCQTLPIPEMDTPTSLYWNDPACCNNDPCLVPSCVDSIPATWYVGADLLTLFRDQLHGETFQTDGATGQGLLNESTLDSAFDAGTRVTLGKAVGDWYRLEGSYWGGFGWEDTAAVRNNDPNAPGGVGNMFSPFSDFGDPAPINGFDFNNFASISYASDLKSFELNLRRRVALPAGDEMHRRSLYSPIGSSRFLNRRSEASFLVGVRYFELDDQFGYRAESSVPAGGSITAVNIDAQNRMIGAQIGMLSQFSVRQRGWLDVEIKGGIYQNEVTLNSQFQNTSGGVATNFAGLDQQDQTSWVGELSLIYNHQIASSLTFRIGYNALAMADVALGSQNFTDNLGLLSRGPVSAENNGDIVYHGPSIGLTWVR